MNEDLISLAEQASVCQRCGLSERRRTVVFGEGNPHAPLVLVGEGPGDEEDKTGRPFVGKAGKLLDKALADCGLDRTMVYICNTVKCRAAEWSTGKPINRPPTDVETFACRHWLLPQLEAISPEVILCIGAPSAKNLIKKNFKITQERGEVFREGFAWPMIATLHPAYILRQSSPTNDGGYSLLVSDIAKAWKGAVKLRERREAHSLRDQAPSSGPAIIQPRLFDEF